MNRIIPFVFFSVLIIYVSLLNDDSSNIVNKNKYSEVSIDIKKLPDVVELFTLSCSNCKNMEGLIKPLNKMIEKPIYKIHAVFSKNTFKEAYLYYSVVNQLTEKTELQQEAIMELYDLVQQLPLLSLPEETYFVADFFNRFNIIKPIDLNKVQHLTILSMTKKSQELVDELKLSSVPAILVKSKYLVKLNEHKDLDDLARTINYLLHYTSQ